MEARPHAASSSSNADFVPVATPPDAPRRRPPSHKRKASSAGSFSSSTSKRLAKDRSTPFPFFPPVHNGPVTRARQSPSKMAFVDLSRAAVAGPPSRDATRDAGAPSDAVAPPEEDPGVGKEEPFVDLDFEAIRSRGRDVHVVPTLAGWFQWTKIHPLEERSVVSFFDGKMEDRTPDVYLEIRDSIVKKFHADPQSQIEVKDLEVLPGGDLEARQEVLEFLDHWGLVNFHPYPPGDSDAKDEDDSAETKDPDADGAAKDFSLLEKLYKFDESQSLASSMPRAMKRTGSFAASMLPRLLTESTSKVSEEVVRPAEPSVEYHCNACSGDCSRKRYHCQKQADFDLCSECFNAEKFGQGMVASDFILMDSAVGDGGSGGNWTDQETLLLLEALELFGANWSEIAEHVATKTKAECILHFIKMPIEEPFLDGADNPNTVQTGNTDQASANMEVDASNIVQDASGKSLENGDLPTTPPKSVTVTNGYDELDDAKKDSSNIVSDALVKAFQAVGTFPEQEDGLSFAESGNPVMALAAFIAGIVEPDAAMISTKSSLKAVYEESPGIQLATRHCFTLEDPPKDNDSEVNNHKSSVPLDSEVAQEENPAQIEDGMKEILDTDIEKTHRTEELPVSSEECLKTLDAREPSSVLVPERCEATNESCGASNRNEDHIQSLSEENASGAMKAPEDLPSQEEGTPIVTTKETEDVIEVENMKFEQNSTNLDNVEETKTSAVVDMVCSTSGDGKELEQTIISHPVDAGEEKKVALDEVEKEKTVATEEEGKDDKLVIAPEEEGKGDKVVDFGKQNNGQKIKRAAVTALAAAAVKAKVLARQEEDQIRHLASMVIGKQLHKLEMKLALINDLDGLLMRVREQLDRARKKLFLERTQIIAARYGASSSSRPLQGAVPMRFAAVHGISGPRQPNVPSHKPPITKP